MLFFFQRQGISQHVGDFVFVVVCVCCLQGVSGGRNWQWLSRWSSACVCVFTPVAWGKVFGTAVRFRCDSRHWSLVLLWDGLLSCYLQRCSTEVHLSVELARSSFCLPWETCISSRMIKHQHTYVLNIYDIQINSYTGQALIPPFLLMDSCRRPIYIRRGL